MDKFQLEAFDYMANYFESSLAELSHRNPGIDTTFRRIDANRFSAIAYRDGEPVARATIFLGTDSFANGIALSHSEIGGTNSFNELLTATADDEDLYFTSLGMSHRVSYDNRDKKLTMEGAAEHYWTMFIYPLQPRGGR